VSVGAVATGLFTMVLCPDLERSGYIPTAPVNDDKLILRRAGGGPLTGAGQGATESTRDEAGRARGRRPARQTRWVTPVDAHAPQGAGPSGVSALKAEGSATILAVPSVVFSAVPSVVFSPTITVVPG